MSFDLQWARPPFSPLVGTHKRPVLLIRGINPAFILCISHRQIVGVSNRAVDSEVSRVASSLAHSWYGLCDVEHAERMHKNKQNSLTWKTFVIVLSLAPCPVDLRTKSETCFLGQEETHLVLKIFSALTLVSLFTSLAATAGQAVLRSKSGTVAFLHGFLSGRLAAPWSILWLH